MDTFPDYYEHQIALDIKRKLSLSSDAVDSEAKKETLSQVLNCYVKRNSNVGYCQGFNYITNYLYERGFPEEEVFWMFTHLIENVVSPEYFITMNSLIVDQKILKHLVQLLLPKVHKVLSRHDIDIDTFSS